MNTFPENLTSSAAPDECRQVLNGLLLRWPEETNDGLSSALLDHLSRCRSCLQKWIALEAAAELANLPGGLSADHTVYLPSFDSSPPSLVRD